jgi:hypothetical protein
MARDDSGDRLLRRVVLMSVLDGTRPSGIPGWVSPVAPRGYPGRRRGRALGRRAAAAGPGRVDLRCWLRAGGVGLGTEAPTRAEAQQYIEQQKDLMRKRGLQVPATARRQTLTARQRSQYALYGVAFPVVGMVLRVRYGLRHPRRLTVGAIADEAWTVVFFVLRAPRAVQRRRPRIAAGSALVVAGSLARLRAASAEPLR